VKLVYLITEDWFFRSHFLERALTVTTGIIMSKAA
jgi:hypothetical protein